MLSSRARATSLAALLAVGGLGALATPAHAAEGRATIATGTDDVWVGDKLDLSGTCSSGTTAVITIEQEEGVVALGSADVTGGAFKATVDLKKAYWGPATASVDCLAYGVEKPVAHASTDFFIDDEDWPFEELEVTLSQEKVALGGTLTVSATCPEGSDVAAILAGNEKADEAFFEQEVTPASSGAVSARIKIAATDGVEPEVGDALAVVVCGDDDMPMPQLLGDKAAAGKLLADQKPMTAMADSRRCSRRPSAWPSSPSRPPLRRRPLPPPRAPGPPRPRWRGSVQHACGFRCTAAGLHRLRARPAGGHRPGDDRRRRCRDPQGPPRLSRVAPDRQAPVPPPVGRGPRRGVGRGRRGPVVGVTGWSGRWCTPDGGRSVGQ